VSSIAGAAPVQWNFGTTAAFTSADDYFGWSKIDTIQPIGGSDTYNYGQGNNYLLMMFQSGMSDFNGGTGVTPGINQINGGSIFVYNFASDISSSLQNAIDYATAYSIITTGGAQLLELDITFGDMILGATFTEKGVASVVSQNLGGFAPAIVTGVNNQIGGLFGSFTGDVSWALDGNSINATGIYEFGGGTGSFQYAAVETVPEPASIALLGVGLLGFGFRKARSV
jgi:hypothetical protein